MITRFPKDLDALGAREALAATRGDGHVISPSDIRLFETGCIGPGIGYLRPLGRRRPWSPAPAGTRYAGMATPGRGDACRP